MIPIIDETLTGPGKRVRRKLRNTISNNYGVYSGIVDETGKHNRNPTEYQAIHNMVEYMKNNNPEESNVYRPEFMHHSINLDINQPLTMAKMGGRLRKLELGGPGDPLLVKPTSPAFWISRAWAPLLAEPPKPSEPPVSTSWVGNSWLPPGTLRDTTPTDVPFSPDIQRATSRQFRTLPGVSKLPVEINDTKTKLRPGIDWKARNAKTKAVAESLVPFVSNIWNSFKKPPEPKRPNLLDYPVFRDISLADQRTAINRNYGVANKATETQLPENTAEAVKAYNRGQQVQELSRVNEVERNANIQVKNQGAQADMHVQSVNKAKLDAYEDRKIDRIIAQQREQSANISNAADKYIGIKNEKEKSRVDIEKTKTLATAYKTSGVFKRERIRMRDAGIKDPMGLDYEDIVGMTLKEDDKEKSYGGRLRRLI